MKTTIETNKNDSKFAECTACHKELTEFDRVELAIVQHLTYGTSTNSTLFCNDCAMKVAEVLQKAVAQNAQSMIAPALKAKSAKVKPPTNPAFDHITLNDVRSVYSGKAHSCMCGCSGKYYYASAYKNESSKERGYEVGDDEVSDKMIKRVFNIVSTSEHVHIECNEYAETTINGRAYVLYFTNKFAGIPELEQMKSTETIQHSNG